MRRSENPRRDAHHMWSAGRGEDGRVHLRRSKQEKESFEQEKRRAMLKAASKRRDEAKRKQEAKDTCAAMWGLFGADLVDDSTFSTDIPVAVVRRFNASDRREQSPRVPSWEELRRAYGSETVQEIRQSVADGIRTRSASKYLNLPFIMTKDVLNTCKDVPPAVLRETVDLVKLGRVREAFLKHGGIAQKVSKVFRDFADASSRKIAVDEAAKSYYEEYYGLYGQDLVQDVKKRVKADMAGAWMRKNGVDDVAAAYWENYYGAYGSAWVSVVPAKLSPSNVRK